MAAHQAPPSLGFSRQEHWSGLPFPSPMHESEKWKWSRSVVSNSSWPRGLQPTRLLRPWDSPGKSTGVLPLPSPAPTSRPLQMRNKKHFNSTLTKLNLIWKILAEEWSIWEGPSRSKETTQKAITSPLLTENVSSFFKVHLIQFYDPVFISSELLTDVILYSIPPQRPTHFLWSSNINHHFISKTKTLQHINRILLSLSFRITKMTNLEEIVLAHLSLLQKQLTFICWVSCACQTLHWFWKNDKNWSSEHLEQCDISFLYKTSKTLSLSAISSNFIFALFYCNLAPSTCYINTTKQESNDSFCKCMPLSSSLPSIQ